jgi:hypothetical protein
VVGRRGDWRWKRYAALRGRGENEWVGREKNRRKGLINDKLAPHVRENIGVKIFSFYGR